MRTARGRSPEALAHPASSYHRDQLAASTQAGCFHCGAMFAPSMIARWIDGDITALCPRCGIDSVIGDAAGFPIDRELLARMQAMWFGTRTEHATLPALRPERVRFRVYEPDLRGVALDWIDHVRVGERDLPYGFTTQEVIVEDLGAPETFPIGTLVLDAGDAWWFERRG